jgi:hypothetical protein
MGARSGVGYLLGWPMQFTVTAGISLARERATGRMEDIRLGCRSSRKSCEWLCLLQILFDYFMLRHVK